MSTPRNLISIVAFLFLSAGLLLGCSSEDASSQQAYAQEASATSDSLPTVTVFKSPTCSCCKKWVTHMRENGFTVKTKNMSSVQPVKNRLGVPRNLRSCHTAHVGGEVVEGHVPASLVKQYLRTDSSKAAGLAVPGMPVGSPGMEVEGRADQPYDVIAFMNDGRTGVYARQR